jgi:hypothetical protein
MNCEVVDILAFSLTWSLYFYSFSSVGVGSWFACCAFLMILGTWYGLVIYLSMGYWVLSIMFRSFGLMGVAVVRICDLYIITLHLQLFS